MTWSVYQHWDPLKVCVVGRSYPPEFYSWITSPHIRTLFERIAIETEEDYQCIIRKLQEFGVQTVRPDLPTEPFKDGKYLRPPVTPRDHTIMIGSTFYSNIPMYDFGYFYWNARQSGWPDCNSAAEIDNLPIGIREHCIELHEKYQQTINNTGYNNIFNLIKSNGNYIKTFLDPRVTGAMVSRIGKDLYFGTYDYNEDVVKLQSIVDAEFNNTRNHAVNTGGHSDGTYCPVCPGLIISSYDVKTYKDTFPGWEVVYLPYSNLGKVSRFRHMKNKSQGKWWIPGFEHDQEVADLVETYMNDWTGYVEETIFDVNMLIIDPKNVLVFNYNKKVFDALSRYGITAHIVPFRHRYFWDGGVHCITSDLHREGSMQDYFPEKKENITKAKE